MSNLCIGIATGSTLTGNPLIADFRLEPIRGDRESLELIVDGYEPPVGDKPPISKIVTLTLRRKGLEMPVWRGMVNNLTLDGAPRLVWATA